MVAPAHALVSEYLHETWDPAHIGQLMACMSAQAAGQGAGSGAPFRIDLLTRDYQQAGQGRAHS